MLAGMRPEARRKEVKKWLLFWGANPRLFAGRKYRDEALFEFDLQWAAGWSVESTVFGAGGLAGLQPTRTISKVSKRPPPIPTLLQSDSLPHTRGGLVASRPFGLWNSRPTRRGTPATHLPTTHIR